MTLGRVGHGPSGLAGLFAQRLEPAAAHPVHPVARATPARTPSRRETAEVMRRSRAAFGFRPTICRSRPATGIAPHPGSPSGQLARLPSLRARCELYDIRPGNIAVEELTHRRLFPETDVQTLSMPCPW
jgi:hypothetical protein